jgi:hypothetical protein
MGGMGRPRLPPARHRVLRRGARPRLASERPGRSRALPRDVDRNLTGGHDLAGFGARASAKFTLRPRRVQRPIASRSSPGATDRYCTDSEIVVRRLPLAKSWPAITAPEAVVSSRAATTPPWKIPVCALSSSAYGRNSSTASASHCRTSRAQCLLNGTPLAQCSRNQSRRRSCSPAVSTLSANPVPFLTRRVCRSIAVIL